MKIFGYPIRRAPAQVAFVALCAVVGVASHSHSSASSSSSSLPSTTISVSNRDHHNNRDTSFALAPTGRPSQSRNDSLGSAAKNVTQPIQEAPIRRTNIQTSSAYKNQDSRRRYVGPQNRFQDGDDTRVPFWNIAHMINSIEQVAPVLINGSNGIEVDISFDKRGVPVECYHGFPCDCGRHCHHREDFVGMIRYLAKISIPPATSNLQVVLLDLKLSDLNVTQKQVAGEALASILSDNLYEPYWHARERAKRQSQGDDQLQFYRPPVRVVVSINHVTDAVLVRSFIGILESNRWDFMRQFIGFDVGMNDELGNITSMWQNELNGVWNIWQGDGLTNCANLARGVSRLKEALQVRNDQGPFKKVYYWTVDILYQIRSVFRLGLDAVLTNQPDRVIQVLEEPEFRNKYRLATPFDDPFMQFWIAPSKWRMSFPTLDEAKETLENIQKTGEKFIKTLPDGIVAAFKKVSATVASRNN